MENNREISQILEIELPCDATAPLLGTYPRK
jgi:hypothetical protein